MRGAGYVEHRTVVEKRRYRRRLERCRHDDDAQIVARPPGLTGQREPEVGVDAAFVKLVEHNGAETEAVPRSSPRCCRQFFTSFTGASGVTILALGGVLMPVLLSAGYSQRNSLGLLTGAGSLGMLFPPCLPLMLYAIISRIEMQTIFLGAVIPGTAGRDDRDPGHLAGPQVVGNRAKRFVFREAVRTVWAAKWELLIPVVAMVALFSGIATPVEASAITAFYAFLTQTLFHRDLSFAKACRTRWSNAPPGHRRRVAHSRRRTRLHELPDSSTRCLTK